MDLRLYPADLRHFHPVEFETAHIPLDEPVSNSKAGTHNACLVQNTPDNGPLFLAELDQPIKEAGRYRLTGNVEGNGKACLFEGEAELSRSSLPARIACRISPDVSEYFGLPRQQVHWELRNASSDKFVGETQSEAEIYRLPVSSHLADINAVPLEFLRHLSDIVSGAGIAPDAAVIQLSSEASHIAQIVNSLFGHTPPNYDVVQGAPHFTFIPRVGRFDDITLYLKRYLAAYGSKSATLNCYDAAALVQYYLGGVASPGTVEFCYMAPFGYLAKTDLIGRGQCNNPFYDAPGVTHTPVTSQTDPDRSGFGNHAFCRIAATGQITDSCAGPHIGTESLSSYLTAVIDKVTPTPPDYRTGTSADVTTHKGVTSVQSLARVDLSGIVETTAVTDFREVVGFTTSLYAPDSGATVFPGNLAPDTISVPHLKGWDIVYEEVIPGYPEMLRYFRMSDGNNEIELSTYVSSDGIAFARNRYLTLGSTHHMASAIFEKGPDGLGDNSAISVSETSTRILWLDRNLVLDLFVHGNTGNAKAIARELGKIIGDCATGAPFKANLDQSDLQTGDVDTISLGAGLPGLHIHPVQHGNADDLKLVSRSPDTLVITALTPDRYEMPIIVFDPKTLQAALMQADMSFR